MKAEAIGDTQCSFLSVEEYAEVIAVVRDSRYKCSRRIAQKQPFVQSP